MSNTDLCKKCGFLDRYSIGEFSYCRYCHLQAQKRYLERKKLGESVSKAQPPKRTVEQMIKTAPRKSVCKQGHPLTPDNVQETSQRNGRHVYRRCKTCQKNIKRRKYGLPIEPAPVSLGDMLDSTD